MSLPTINPLERLSAAQHDAWIEVSHLAVLCRKTDLREIGDRMDGNVQAIGHMFFFDELEARKANTVKPTDRIIDAAIAEINHHHANNLSRMLERWGMSVHSGGPGWPGYMVSGQKITVFVRTDEGKRLAAIDRRRFMARESRENIWREQNPGAGLPRHTRAFRHVASFFDESNPEHGAYVTVTRQQLEKHLAKSDEPVQMEMSFA